MERLALIIKGLSHNEDELIADREYVATYARFFNSIAGGAWDDNEILILEEPSIPDLSELVNKLKPDYAVTVLIGHGGIKDGSQLFLLSKDTVIKPGQFTLNIDKQLIIVESCRTDASSIPFTDLENKIPMYKWGGYVRGQIDRQTSKYLFFEQLKSCDNGIVICNACSPYQTANNYYFSNSLLQFGQNLFLDTRYHYRTFDILDMMPIVQREVSEMVFNTHGIIQTPELNGTINFPFAVSKFDLLVRDKNR
ncbi:MAG: hypothetical protein U0W65_08930 [Bacteroidia bacterium]